jgi:hypothetical protein
VAGIRLIDPSPDCSLIDINDDDLSELIACRVFCTSGPVHPISFSVNYAVAGANAGLRAVLPAALLAISQVVYMKGDQPPELDLPPPCAILQSALCDMFCTSTVNPPVRADLVIYATSDSDHAQSPRRLVIAANPMTQLGVL